MAFRVIYGQNQQDFTAATEELVAEGIETIAAARSIIRAELGIKALRFSRRWHNPADHVVEGWCAARDGEGYFIEEEDQGCGHSTQTQS